MILYNMRYRGPYEYDKFALNVFQIHNALQFNEMYELKTNEEKKDSLYYIQKEVDKRYKELIGTEKEKGLTQTIYEKFYTLKGGH